MGLSLPQRLAVAEFLAKRFSSVRKNDLNPEAAAEMEPGERYAAKFAGRVAAWVSVPQPTVRVNDKDALLDWCRKNLPMAIETVEQVRPDTAKVLTEQVKKHGGWLNTETGEVVPVDGIGTGEPSPRVNLSRDAEEILAAAWRDGEIDLAGMLAIEAAPETAPPDLKFADEDGFLNPEMAAAHAVLVQKGFSTPPREAYRMLRDGGVAAERARAWLADHGLDPDDPSGEDAPWPLPESRAA